MQHNLPPNPWLSLFGAAVMHWARDKSTADQDMIRAATNVSLDVMNRAPSVREANRANGWSDTAPRAPEPPPVATRQLPAAPAVRALPASPERAWSASRPMSGASRPTTRKRSR